MVRSLQSGNPGNQTVNFCLQPVTHNLKAIGLRVNLVYLGTLYIYPVTRQIFQNIVGMNLETLPLANPRSLPGRFPQIRTVRHCVKLKNQVSNALRKG